MHNNSINKLLDLKGVKVNNIVNTDAYTKIFVSTFKSQQHCPSCNRSTSQIHDYRNQIIKDLPIMNRHTIIILKKRRYVCTCGKKFYEKYEFLPRYHRMTNRVVQNICSELRNSIPISLVASKLNVSTHTVSRVFDHIKYPNLKRLPEVLSIDEFRGNAETAKFQCILVDTKKSKVLDILPDRKQTNLIEFFKAIPRYERQKVKFFVCDMWNQYADIARTYLPNAKIIVDKYHFVRQVTWAIENVRKRVQKTMPANLRKYYKRSRSLILKRSYKLTEVEKEELDLMLLYNDDLRQAYRLKEEFYTLCQLNKYSEQRIAFSEWIIYAESTRIPEFNACINAFRNWHKEILNAFKYGYTNGPTEGFNNKIKVLKRVSYGLRNFNRLRNRILHICS